ncbi:MAG TPA: UPF0182 family protein, partial [Gemmatimonadales bacterium]
MTPPRILPRKSPPPRRRLPIGLAIAAVVALVIFFPGSSTLLTDWWWFKEIGYQVVFTRTLLARALLFVAGGGLAAGVLYLNLRIAQRGLLANPILLQLAESAPRLNITATLRRLTIPIAAGVGLLSGLAAMAAWDVALRAVYGVPFGIADPVFGRDVGFYIFTWPALSAAFGFLVTLTVLSLLLVIPVYALRGDLVPGPRRVQVEPSAGVHVAVLLAVFLALMALELWLVDIPGLLYSTTGPLIGASYTDMHARLPAMRVSAVVAAIAAVVVIVGAVRGRLAQFGIGAVAAYALVGVVGRWLFPLAMQNFIVAPTELTRETPYLKNHIIATRQAWGLDSVEVKELRGEAGLTLANIRANGPTIDNVRLWDRDPLLMTFGQLQEIRTYYDFVSVDDDRYWIDGKYRQVLLSPRELNAASLPTRTFINEHLTFTHGMGLTMS